MRKAIFGVSGYGKSYLAHALAKSYRAQGIKVLVCDPHLEAWPCDFITDDAYRLMKLAKRSQRCAIFIDEAGEAIGRGKRARELQWLTTGSRKWGHTVYIMAQRASMVEKSVRAQCLEGYIFRQDEDDAKELRKQFAEPLLEQVANLDKYHFMHVVPGERPRLMKL